MLHNYDRAKAIARPYEETFAATPLVEIHFSNLHEQISISCYATICSATVINIHMGSLLLISQAVGKPLVVNDLRLHRCFG